MPSPLPRRAAHPGNPRARRQTPSQQPAGSTPPKEEPPVNTAKVDTPVAPEPEPLPEDPPAEEVRPEPEPSPSVPEEPSSEEEEQPANGIRPDFKAAMDSIEAFYDDYCAFMKKYSENPTDLDMLTEYTDMLSKLDDMESKFAAWESKDLTNAEMIYYLEVYDRILGKLSKIAD